MNVGLMAAALFFTAIDAVSFLACGVLMMRFICMYTEEGAMWVSFLLLFFLPNTVSGPTRRRPLLQSVWGWGGV